MKRILTLAAIPLSLAAAGLAAHPMMGAITWNRHVSRIVYDKCADCHRPQGSAFSLLDYAEARGAAERIKQEVLARRMPPWGAVAGFGDLVDDTSLSDAQIEMLVDWVETGMARGNNRRVLPEAPPAPPAETPFRLPENAVPARGTTTLERGLTLVALLPSDVPADTSARIVAVLPDGTIEPLVWLYRYDDAFAHPFRLRQPLALPAGTEIRGVPPEATLWLIPARD